MTDKLKREFTMAWLVFVLLVIVSEFVLSGGARETVRWILFGWFLLFEGWSIGRPKPGDSFTEHVRVFYRQEKSRKFLVYGFIAYAVFALIALKVELTVWGIPLTLLSLVIGLAAWLVPHLLARPK